MKLDLKKIDPETPTEFILKEYGKFLERLIQELRADLGRDPRFIISADMERVVDAAVIERYWYDGIAMSGVSPHEGGHMLRVKTKPLDGDKHFACAIFMNRAELCTKTRAANACFELYKQGLQHIAGIYGVKLP